MKNAYGPSIILFTCIVRLFVFPLNYKQIASSQMTQALQPKVKEIREKYADDKNLQNQMTALLYQETDVNPLAGCLPALVQIPVFLSLYRSFLNLAQTKQLDESFLWIPNLEGPTFGERTTDWLFTGWHDFVPSLGWQDTIAYLSIPLLLVVAQSLSLRILTPPSDDPAIQQSQVRTTEPDSESSSRGSAIKLLKPISSHLFMATMPRITPAYPEIPALDAGILRSQCSLWSGSLLGYQ